MTGADRSSLRELNTLAYTVHSYTLAQCSGAIGSVIFVPPGSGSHIHCTDPDPDPFPYSVVFKMINRKFLTNFASYLKYVQLHFSLT